MGNLYAMGPTPITGVYSNSNEEITFHKLLDTHCDDFHKVDLRKVSVAKILGCCLALITPECSVVVRKVISELNRVSRLPSLSTPPQQLTPYRRLQTVIAVNQTASLLS